MAYECEICHGTFSRPENLLRHKRNSHRSGDLHPYLCSCGRSYTRSDILLRHQRGCEVHNNGGKPLSAEQQQSLAHKRRGRKRKAIHQPMPSKDPSYLAGVAAASHKQQQQQQQQQRSQQHPQLHSQDQSAHNQPHILNLENWSNVASFDSDPGLDSEYWNYSFYSNTSTPASEYEAYPGLPLYSSTDSHHSSSTHIPQQTPPPTASWNTLDNHNHSTNLQSHQQPPFNQQSTDTYSSWMDTLTCSYLQQTIY